MKVDMRTLNNGIVFHVINGNWNGYIFSKNGKKYMHIYGLNDDRPLSGFEDLYIKIIGEYAHEKPDGTGHWIGSFNNEKWMSIIIQEFGVDTDTAQVMLSEMMKIYNKELELSIRR